MTEESNSPDPYAPPRADPLPASLPVADSGSLWRVVDGRLQFRDGAKLPDVCFSGGPEGEAGKWFSQRYEAQPFPGWLRIAALLAFGVAGVAGMVPSYGGRVALFIACIALPGFLAKRPRLEVFRSKLKERAILLRTLVLSGVAVLLINLPRGFLPQYTPSGAFIYMALAFGMLHLALHLTGKTPPLRSLGDGWFEWKNMKPEVVLRLEEIQQRQPPYPR